MLLTACAGKLPASIAGGECKVFSPPEYAIRGKTQADQNWIDDTEESGIAGCGWQRPKVRPVAMPVKAPQSGPLWPPAPQVVHPAPIVTQPLTAPPPKKKHWWQRLKRAKPQ